MEIRLAENYGFCFGVKRAIRLAEANPGALTVGPLIHNPKEIERLRRDFSVAVNESIDTIPKNSRTIIRTHGIEQENRKRLETISADVIDATCPFVTKPQEIVQKMSHEGYQVVIFGDSNHPEVKGVRSYAGACAQVVSSVEELSALALSDRVALVSQTTKKASDFGLVAAALTRQCREVRVFNTICNATFDNQEATAKLASEVGVMLIVGGRNSSNTRQLHAIALGRCEKSYLIEDSGDLDPAWFEGAEVCGIGAGASTPDWIIKEVIDKIHTFSNKP
jgi:4-hydroxy-3-methylbut-2-enyl diphosphate reductase